MLNLAENRFRNSSLEVADRNNLARALKELNLNVSGMVDDASAATVGKFQGAEYVITGQLVDTGGAYRYRVNAIKVETGKHEASERHNIRNDRATKNLVSALRKSKPVVREASYGAPGSAAPSTAGVFLDRGIMFASQGDYELAIENFTEAIKLDPNFATAYNNRGMMYSKKGDYNRAIADFSQVIKLNPNNADTYNNRGMMYSKKGDNDRAIADYTQAIRLDQDNFWYKVRLEAAQKARGR
jgi:Flp pilus assembly protein TadD